MTPVEMYQAVNHPQLIHLILFGAIALALLLRRL